MSCPPSALYQPLDLKGSTVLLTGATAGIGEATAWRFAELRCHLVGEAQFADNGRSDRCFVNDYDFTILYISYCVHNCFTVSS